MHLHTATQITTLPYTTVNFLALVNGKLLHAGTDDHGASVTYGDERGPRLDGFAPTVMSLHVDVADGKPLYVGVRNGKEFVVHGRSEGVYCDRICGLSFSPEGSVGYGATEGQEGFVVVDGVAGKRYPSIWTHAFANGKMLYAADMQKLDRGLLQDMRAWNEAYNRCRTRMVFGTEEGAPYKAILKDGCRPLIAGGRQVYGVLHPDGTCAIVDGSCEGKRYHSIRDLTCDPTDGIPLYTAILRDSDRPGRYVLVRGTEEVVWHDHMEYASWVNGKPLYVAWQIAGEDKQSFLMYGSDRFDYGCHIGPPDIVDGQPLFIGQTGGFVGDERPLGRFVVHGDTQGPAYYDIHELEIVDGKPMYVGSLAEERYDDEGDPIPPHQRVVYGAKEGTAYARVTDLTHAGTVPIYCAWTDEQQACVVVGDEEGYCFDAVFSLQFDWERREVSYGALTLKDRKVHRVVVNV